MKPITREEQYLNRLAGETEQTIPSKPELRKEQYLSRLCGGDNLIPEEPINREEQYLANLCGEEVDVPKPITRLEQYMAFAAGESEDKPEKPITREEWYWDNYQGGAVPEAKTVSGTLIHVTDAVEEPAKKLAVTMTPSQEATPFVGDTTTEPYLSKTASTTGNKRYLDKIVGGTVAWNQLVDTDTTSVTVPTGHKYIAKINDTWTSGNGGTVSVTGGTDMFIDLTLMFGSTIADYIYSLEQSEAGAGVQWLKDHGFIDELYRAYNAGELISAKPTAFTVGGDTYTLGGVDLRGLFLLDAQNNLYCDGDELTPDGIVTTNYKLVDFGTLTWKAYNQSTYPNLWYSDSFNDRYDNYTPWLGFPLDTYSERIAWTTLRDNDKSWGRASAIAAATPKRIWINDSDFAGKTATEVATLLSGKWGLYKLETPTTSSSTPYTNPAPIENGDTEAFTDTRAVPIPVGNESHYAGEYEIEGYESVTVYQAQAQDEPNPTEYEVEFTEQGTVYGGVIDIVTGVLTITWGHIASYNGETLTGRWMSSLDVYAEGTTPTTGAEVAYELASPITAELTPQEVQMLLGENYFWAENGENIELTYKARAAQRVLAMNRKLNLNKQALEIKRNGGVIIDKPIIKPISDGGLKK